MILLIKFGHVATLIAIFHFSPFLFRSRPPKISEWKSCKILVRNFSQNIGVKSQNQPLAERHNRIPHTNLSFGDPRSLRPCPGGTIRWTPAKVRNPLLSFFQNTYVSISVFFQLAILFNCSFASLCHKFDFALHSIFARLLFLKVCDSLN